MAGASVTEIDARLLRDWPLPEPGSDADKDDRGSTLVIAGGSETPGAAALAARSALRAGAGRLAVATSASVAGGLALALVEARVIALAESDFGGPAADGLAKIEAPQRARSRGASSSGRAAPRSFSIRWRWTSSSTSADSSAHRC
jgi:NAD(P)H-hydrate repair Nnr-like enzyme with NAD(P)H-hydrate dehydratase domain